MCVSLGCGTLSAKCTASPQCPWIVFVILGVTLDSAKTPFAKTPFSRFQIFSFLIFFSVWGGSVWGFSGSSVFFLLFGAVFFCCFLAERAGEKKQKKKTDWKNKVFLFIFRVFLSAGNRKPGSGKAPDHPQIEKKKQKEKKNKHFL